MKKIICTVTNDLTYDQRMQRICTTLAQNGYHVTLAGRQLKHSSLLQQKSYQQKRLSCFFNTGFLFYAEYNLRLFWWLLFQRADILCAIDLDTILPVYFVSRLRKQKRVYDAHELFTEQKEIVTRPAVHAFWLLVEKFALPRFPKGYTVNEFIVNEFKRRYGVVYLNVRNLPRRQYNKPVENSTPFFIYQGAVNEGRSFETLIPAMQQVKLPLKIFGKGNFFEQVKQMVLQYGLEKKVELAGFADPKDLKHITATAYAGLTLFEKTGLNQYYSLSNRFFDYIMAGIPQVCVNYPEYKAINDLYNVALMIDDTGIETITTAMNRLAEDSTLYEQLKRNCVIAREALNWEAEEKKLLAFYAAL